MKIAVIDGQGGGIGRAVIEKLRAEFGNGPEILALGTNALATSAMLRAGADEGASGEYAVVLNAPKADIIAGCIGILTAGSMLGEITPAMAEAISLSTAEKVVIPLAKCGIHVAGVVGKPLPHTIDDAVALIKAIAEHSDAEHSAKTEVFLADEAGKLTLVMESADKITPAEDHVVLEANGEKKELKARIREIDLAGRRVVLEKTV